MSRNDDDGQSVPPRGAAGQAGGQGPVEPGGDGGQGPAEAPGEDRRTTAPAGAAGAGAADRRLPRWSRPYLKPDRVQLVEDAVRAAELKTAGEIVPMIVRRSSTVGHVPLLVMSLLLALFMIVDGPGWQYAWLGEHWAWYVLDAALLLLVSPWLARFETVQRLLTTKADQIEQVDMRAALEFYSSDIHHTRDATGVLLFVSLMEHRAVVLADEAIADQVGPHTWDEVCRTMIQGIKEGHVGLGLAAAIERCGDILASEFPIAADDVNELRDVLIIKD